MDMPETSDDELLRRYQQGDSAAFNQLLARHQAPLFSFITRMVRDRALAEDLFQETFMRMIRETQRGRIRDNPRRWLFTVANRLALDHLRRQNRWKMLSTSESNAETGGYEPVAEAESPLLQMEQAELRHEMETAIEALPVEQRQVVLLKQHGDLTFREIAELLGVPLGTVLARMHRATNSLRKSLRSRTQ